MLNVQQGNWGPVLEEAATIQRRLEHERSWVELNDGVVPGSPMAFTLDGAYCKQVYLECASLMVLSGEKWNSVRRKAYRWRRGLTHFVNRTEGLFVILLWGTARDTVIEVHPEIVEFQRHLARLNARQRDGFPRYVLVTGGSQSGAMGSAIHEFKTANHAAPGAPTVVNVLLGFLEGGQQYERASTFGLCSPPLFSFPLRLYTLAMCGRRVLNIAVDGGGGTLDEIISDVVDGQHARRCLTVHARRGVAQDPLATFGLVSTSLDDGGFFWDGLDRQLNVMHDSGTMPKSEYPPVKHFVLDMPKARRSVYAKQNGRAWKARHKRPLLQPRTAAEQVLALADTAFRSMAQITSAVRLDS